MDDSRFSDLDLAFADFLAKHSGLAAGQKERLWRLAGELSRALGDGHSCLPLAGEDERLLRGLAAVGDGQTATPLVLWRGRLYLSRYFHYERRLAAHIVRLAGAAVAIPSSGGAAPPLPGGDERQRQAVELARQRALAIVCGGPGTGKTTTVVAMLAALLQDAPEEAPPAVALAAPTGKAAMRLGEAVGRSLTRLNLSERVARAIPTAATTLHRLLGVRRGSPSFQHHEDNPLPWDVVVVDEASMVDLAMMCKLTLAIKPGARLILLGDKDQLASVESGAVLADLIASLPGNTVELTTTYRFEAGIASLAEAIRMGQGGRAWQLLRQGEAASVALLEEDGLDGVDRRYGEIFAELGSPGVCDAQRALNLFGRFRLLCALQHGPRGVAALNRRVELALAGQGFAVRPGTWYHGRPVLITRNDYGLGLFNGDTGVCLADGEGGELRVWFERAEGGLCSFAPSRLPECQTVYAMTVHKSQGSEFDEVAVILPGEDSRVLGRELLYTAVTRARKRVSLLVDEEVLRLTLSRAIERHSGLGERLGDEGHGSLARAGRGQGR